MKIKICGFTRKQDIENAVALGVDFFGFNFYEKSPRYIKIKEAKKILEGYGKDILKIGVFVNPDFLLIEKTVKALDLSGVQLHGNETPFLCRKFKMSFPDKILIKAVRIKGKNDLEKIKEYEADFFLLDSYLENLFGGTGKLLNFEILNKTSLPLHKIFIAGGITPENVSKILQKINPYGIDTASGVEISPGIKDKEKMEKLVKEVRGTKDERRRTRDEGRKTRDEG